ncbi:hypothetical protein [Gloeobacter morelensis]|uniref:Uncharacterized protein n=1 Tax=Gloeobacter morelensis MG652769 TaxID=2781736 RepID=A0ABY3PKE4_9CYAN|nr:hypothetical protein [Gloeobacter morelensis]UFP94140.1 hypothetical protein ISF26_20630 [Gloeobacter morelensis MG652769]
MDSPTIAQAPEPLLISSERFVLGVTEQLDPLVSLQLTGVIKQLVNIAYLMGNEDGKRRAE